MTYRKLVLSAAVAAALGTQVPEAHAQQGPGEIKWFGSVYAKFLDGDRNFENALYNNAETTPGEAGGDQGQGIEFELMFNSQVSSQVEIGGRLKARFNQNFWTNFGGFGPEEEDERSAQYVKMRGVWARITPGYDWIDSATIGSNDWGMFDPWTVGKFRYIDRDNSSGLLFQGAAADGILRWDLARVSLPKLFAGPAFRTTDCDPNRGNDCLEHNDAAWVGQLRWSATTNLNLTGIVSYIRDQEVKPDELNDPDGLLPEDDPDLDGEDNRDGSDTEDRYTNLVVAVKGQYSGFDWMDINAGAWYSDFDLRDETCGPGTYNSDCRFSPTLVDDADGLSGTLNLDFNDLFIDGFGVAIQAFYIDEDYQSVLAARRESDVLITEGPVDGTWLWGTPDYNFGSRNGPGAKGVGWGGWNGEVQQVVSGMADNDFTDFDEPVAVSVQGWKGVTVKPSFIWNDWEFTGEYTYLDYNTNWQACGEQTKDDCIYPRMEGTHSWGVGENYRSPFAPYQDRETQIYALRINYVLDIGNGIDLMGRFKYTDDSDDRVTRQDLLTDAYDGFDAGSVNPDWDRESAIGLFGCVSCDDREAEYYSYGLSMGYQLHPDLYAKLWYEYWTVDLFDGITDVAPVGCGSECAPGSWAEYMTGEHTKNRVGLQLSYFLSGVEFGGTIDYFWGDYDPDFYTVNDAGQIVEFIPAGDTVATPMGNISRQEVDFNQYRLKAFMKVSF